MAENEIVVGVPPERVFSVLADPELYGEWVVAGPVGDLAGRVRNKRSLARLKALAER